MEVFNLIKKQTLHIQSGKSIQKAWNLHSWNYEKERKPCASFTFASSAAKVSATASDKQSVKITLHY